MRCSRLGGLRACSCCGARNGTSATIDRRGAGYKNGIMVGTGRMRSWYQRQWQSEPNPRRWLVAAGFYAVSTLVMVAFAAMAHGIRSHYDGPPGGPTSPSPSFRQPVSC
jgi:hypothetical protein